MIPLTYRIAKTADLNSIIDLYNVARTAGKQNGSCDWTTDYPNMDIINSDIQGECLFLVFNKCELIGAFTLLDTDDLDNEPLDWKPVKSCVPVRICVSPEQQGKGFGALIMKHIIDLAKSKGYQSLRLLASLTNTAANALYSKIGFINKGTLHLYNNEYNAYEYLIY